MEAGPEKGLGEMDTEKIRKRINRLKADRRAALREVDDAKASLASYQATEADTLEAQKLINDVAERIQAAMHEGISGVVGLCLDAVFDDPYTFRIRFDQKRGKTEAVLELSRDGGVYDDPLNEVGGGVIDIVSFALRCAYLLLRPGLRRVVVLDEPFRYVRGDAYRTRTRDILARLADDFGFQFVLNTDVNAFRAG
jgi:hypothetical protein